MCGRIWLVNSVRYYCFWFLTKCPKLFKQGNNRQFLVNYQALLIPQEYLCLHENIFIQEQPLPNHLCKQKHVLLNIHEQQGAQIWLNQAAAENSFKCFVNTVLQYLTSSRYRCQTGTQTSWNVDSSNSRLKIKKNQWYIYILVKSYIVKLLNLIKANSDNETNSDFFLTLIKYTNIITHLIGQAPFLRLFLLSHLFKYFLPSLSYFHSAVLNAGIN